MSKKLIIAISALALAIIAGVVAVVGVFAAQQQKVANTFTITYTANNVSANVIPFYIYKSVDGQTSSPQGLMPATFRPEEAEQTKNISFNLKIERL